MLQWLVLPLSVFAASAQAGEPPKTGPQSETPCSGSWYRSIEEKVTTGDGQGHGPDIGSGEWKSVVEFNLGIRGATGLPKRDTEAWCAYIDRIVSPSHASSAADAAPVDTDTARGPSCGCAKTAAGSAEALVCEDNELSALDRKLAGVYAAALKKAGNEYPPVLRAEQRGWIKGRDDCWKSDDRRGCIRDEYVRRIAELQAGYRLVDQHGPVRFQCDGNPADEVIATFFQTDPSTLIAEHGDSISLMYQQPSGSGIRYQGRNESFLEHQGEAMVTWGYGAQPMRCTKAAEKPGAE